MNPNSSPLLTVLVLLTAAVSACASPDASRGDVAGATDDMVQQAPLKTAFFRSPTGKTTCVHSPADDLGGEYLRCDVEGWGDNAVTLRAGIDGEATIQPASDSAADPSARALPYDQPVDFGAFRCVVRAETGMRCVNLTSLRGFEVSTKAKVTF